VRDPFPARDQALHHLRALDPRCPRTGVRGCRRCGGPRPRRRRVRLSRLAKTRADVPAGRKTAGQAFSRMMDDLSGKTVLLTRASKLLPWMLERKSGRLVFMSSIAGKLPSGGETIYNATKFGVRGFALALREELWGTGVGVSVISPTFVSEAGMWAVTGLKPNPIAGEVSPGQVADAVWTSITKNKREIDDVPIQLRTVLKLH